MDSVPVTSIPRQQLTWSIDTRQKPSSMNVSKRGHGHGHGHDPMRTVPEDPETRKVFIQQVWPSPSLLQKDIELTYHHCRKQTSSAPESKAPCVMSETTNWTAESRIWKPTAANIPDYPTDHHSHNHKTHNSDTNRQHLNQHQHKQSHSPQ